MRTLAVHKVFLTSLCQRTYMCFSGYMETQDKDQKYCYSNNLTAVCSSNSSKVIIYETYLLLYCIILYIGLLPTLSIIIGSVPSGMSVILLALSAVSTSSLDYTQHYIYPHSLFHLHLLLLRVDLHSLHLL